jgi:hypothetical protein
MHGRIQIFTSYNELANIGSSLKRDDLADKVVSVILPLLSHMCSNSLQVRVWTLSLPLTAGGVAPRPIAIMPLNGKVTKQELRGWHDTVEKMLADRGMHIISYNVDGAQVKRSLTHDLLNEARLAGRTKEWRFAHPCGPGHGHLILDVPLLDNDMPWVCTTDGKHAKKNGRNAITSGARVITAGTEIITYEPLAALATSEGTPLKKTDIIGVDKHDDRATSRLCSGQTIEHLSRTQENPVALSVWLYILGSVIDAQQNREMPHEARALALWRGRLFLEGWRNYIDKHPHYSLSTHFLSHEYYDILMIFINSMLVLMLVHRDYYPDLPLLLHVHSTEQVEHLYGCSRAETRAYTFVQFLLSLPKTMLLLQGQVLSSKGAQADANAHRSGYLYSWWKETGINYVNLTSWVSNVTMEKQISTAHRQSNAFLGLLGMVLCIPAPLFKSIVSTSEVPSDSGISEDQDSTVRGSPDEDDALHTEAARLTQLLIADSGVDKDRSSKKDQEIAGLAAATAALFTHTHQQLSV